MNTKPRSSMQQAIVSTLLFTLVLWVVKSAQILFGWDLIWMGIYPGQWHGLIGILSAPLVHGSLEHLFNNTLPLLLLGSVLLYGYPKTWKRTLALVWILSGIGVWLFARQAWHIGASGLTHGIFFYLLLVSILRRDKTSIAIMMIAFFMYGGMVMTIFPREEHISFEAHFFGAAAGVLAALLWWKEDPKPVEKRYEWEEQESEDPVIGDEWMLPEQNPDQEKPHQ